MRVFAKLRANLFERPDLIVSPDTLNGRRHTVDHRGLRRLDKDAPSSTLQRLGAARSIVAHPCEHRADDTLTHGLSRALKKPIDRREITIVRMRRDHMSKKPVAIALNNKRMPTWADEAHASAKLDRPARLPHMNASEPIEPLGKGRREFLGHMLRDEDSRWEMRGEAPEDLDKRRRPARRRADHDERVGCAPLNRRRARRTKRAAPRADALWTKA